jgi:hypothetical protein
MSQGNCEGRWLNEEIEKQFEVHEPKNKIHFFFSNFKSFKGKNSFQVFFQFSHRAKRTSN